MSLFKRKESPHWWTEFVVKGKRVVRSTHTASRRDAEAFERELRGQVAREAGHAKVTPAASLDQACGRYWTEHGRRLRDARNVQRWLLYIVSHIDKDLPFSELSTKHVAEMVAAMRAIGRGEVSINRTVTSLQGVHSRAAKTWEWPVKVIDWRKLKTRERARVRYLEHPEAQALMAELPDHIRAVVLFILTTGLRKSEAFNLTWEKVRPGSVLVIVKGGYEREVALSPEAALVLAEQPRDGRYVFDTTNWRKEFERARTQAGVGDIRWHDLRHTLATWLGRSGAPLEVIRDQLGHSSISVTQKYRHVVSSEVRDSLQRLPALRPNSGNVIPIKKR
jgi:integrase